MLTRCITGPKSAPQPSDIGALCKSIARQRLEHTSRPLRPVLWVYHTQSRLRLLRHGLHPQSVPPPQRPNFCESSAAGRLVLGGPCGYPGTNSGQFPDMTCRGPAGLITVSGMQTQMYACRSEEAYHSRAGPRSFCIKHGPDAEDPPGVAIGASGTFERPLRAFGSAIPGPLSCGPQTHASGAWRTLLRPLLDCFFRRHNSQVRVGFLNLVDADPSAHIVICALDGRASAY